MMTMNGISTFEWYSILWDNYRKYFYQGLWFGVGFWLVGGVVLLLILRFADI